MTKHKNNPKHKKPFHLHVEHFFRLRALLVVVAGLLMIAVARSDTRLLGTFREAYAHGYGQVGSYMREETVRTPLANAVPRPATTSGR